MILISGVGYPESVPAGLTPFPPDPVDPAVDPLKNSQGLVFEEFSITFSRFFWKMESKLEGISKGAHRSLPSSGSGGRGRLRGGLRASKCMKINNNYLTSFRSQKYVLFFLDVFLGEHHKTAGAQAQSTKLLRKWKPRGLKPNENCSTNSKN